MKSTLVGALFLALLFAAGCSRNPSADREDPSASDPSGRTADPSDGTSTISAEGSAAGSGEVGSPPPSDTTSGGSAGLVAAHGQEPASASGEPPPGHPPIEAPVSNEPAPGGAGSESTGLEWSTPRGWKDERPRNPMRKAQFRVPGLDGDPEDAECAVFYFGRGQGGSAKSNATRWVDQFKQPDGRSSQGRSKIAMRSVGGREVMFVEVKGTYEPSAMPGAATPEPKPDFALIGAIVMGPDAPWFFKLTGPERTVEANRAAFESLIASVRSAS